MRHLNYGSREPWLLSTKNEVLTIISKTHRRRVYDFLTPCRAVMEVLRQRRNHFDIIGRSPASSYERYLCEDAFYWLDLTEHPQVSALSNGYRIQTGHTVWGRTAFHWLNQGFCFDVATMTAQRDLTEQFYEGWWHDRTDGIPELAFVMLGRTPSYLWPDLKRRYTQLKLLGQYDADRRRYRP